MASITIKVLSGENGIIKTSQAAKEEHAIQSTCEKLNFELNNFIEKQLSKHENISRASSWKHFEDLGYEIVKDENEDQYCIIATLDNGKKQTYQIQEKADGTQEVVIHANNETLLISGKTNSNPNPDPDPNQDPNLDPDPNPDPNPDPDPNQDPNPDPDPEDECSNGHEYGDWIVETNPTCEKIGAKKRICTRCGYEERQTIEPLGHAPGAEATCTTAQTCTRPKCGAIIKAALGHSYKYGGAMIQMDDNQHGRQCEKCGAWNNLENHKWNNYLSQWEKTHVQYRKTHFTACSVCDKFKTEAHQDKSKCTNTYKNSSSTTKHYKYYICKCGYEVDWDLVNCT